MQDTSDSSSVATNSDKNKYKNKYINMGRKKLSVNENTARNVDYKSPVK